MLDVKPTMGERILVFGSCQGSPPQEIDGYPNYRIPSIIAHRDKPHLFAMCEARTSPSDSDPRNLAYSVSTNLGATWSAPELLTWTGIENMVPNQNGNATLLPGMGAEELILLFCNNYSLIYCCTSSDFGQTWSTPVEVQIPPTIDGYTWKIIAVGPGRGIRAMDGKTLLATIWMSTGDDQTQKPSAVGTICSTDEGSTWTVGEIAWNPTETEINPMEAVIVQKSDGTFLLNIRRSFDQSPPAQGTSNYRALSQSPNGYSGWTNPVIMETQLQDPGCFGSLSQQESLDTMVFSNVVNGEYDPEDPNKNLTLREPLGVRLSTDGGSTWSGPVIYEPKETGYSDVTSINTVICVLYEYGWGSGDPGNIQSICFQRFDAMAIWPT